MRVGSGHAAVTPPFSEKKGEPFRQLSATVPVNRDRKAVERAGEPEDLPAGLVQAIFAAKVARLYIQPRVLM